MRLIVSQAAKNQHTETVTACCWAPNNELYTCGDDQAVLKWSMEGEPLGKVCQLDSFVTAMHWFPSIGGQPADMFVVSCTDGSVRLILKTGRQEKKVDACTAAVISVKWNYDGSTLVTAGEDGTVKTWSRSGMLRSGIATCTKPVYAVCWGPDNQLAYAAGPEMNIQSVNDGVDRRKKVTWKAHEGVVMAVDWNPVNNQLVTGGEDCMYKVWDSFGRQLFQSSAFEHVITSVAWAPHGDVFAVGSFNTLRLCDRTGWSHARERPKSGSLFALSWTSDGTQIAGAGGSGAVVFGQVVGKSLEWQNLEVTLTDATHVRVHDVQNETVDELDFRERIVEMSLAWKHLVLAQPSQCSVYTIPNWATPHMFDLRATVHLIQQAESCFLMIDSINGIQIFSYEGRVMSNVRFPGLRVEFLNSKTISLSNDCLALLDMANNKLIRFFDVRTGRALGTLEHNLEVLELRLSQFSASVADRRVAYVDANRDLYICPATKQTPVKLHTMVEAIIWNDVSDTLLSLADGKLVSWVYPNAVFLDKDLAEIMRTSRDAAEFGKFASFISFFGTRLAVRRADGAKVVIGTDVYPPMLCDFVARGRWEEAIRLCRFVDSPPLWACLAAMGLNGRNLDAAEVALAAIKAVDKLHYVMYIKEIPSVEGRNAEMALYRRQVDEAEAILLQASPPLIYRAIKMNIRLFRWDRALELAASFKTHVDTVLAYRQRYLESIKRPETNEKFLQFGAEFPVDWEAIKAKIATEKARELERGGGGR